MSGAEKQAAADAMQQLAKVVAERLTDEVQTAAVNDLGTLNRYQGELRREKAALKEKLDAAEKSLTSLHGKLLSKDQELDKVKRELCQTHDQLGSANAAVVKSKTCGELTFEAAQAHLEYLSLRHSHKSVEEKAARVRQLLRLMPGYMTELQQYPFSEEPGHLVVLSSQEGTGFHADAYTLLGMAVRYAQSYGKSVLIVAPDGLCEGCMLDAMESLDEQGNLIPEDADDEKG